MKKHIFSYGIEELAPFIDWSYLLHAWGIKHMEHAGEVIHDAKLMLDEIKEREVAKGIFALCEAHSHGDNIIIEGTSLPLLRQQHQQEGIPNLCLSDFVSPYGDNIGLFATTVNKDFGKEYINDEYRYLLAQTLADRLTEATATVMHRAVRTDRNLWGYAENEEMTVEQLNREEYQGIRPAVGYPSLPDQSVIFIIDRILGMEDIGITPTPNGAMYPHASICGIMLHHPASHYFAVGKINEEQLKDYASRRGVSPDEARKFLAKNIQ